MSEKLTPEDRQILMKLAREALIAGVEGKPLAPLSPENLSGLLGELGATFVTLTRHGQLRGCIGALEAYLPLAEDVREHAIAAALKDYRFPSVHPDELDDIEIEISYLSKPQMVDYTSPEDLLDQIHPGVDGVILRDGRYRATFLPQVWEKIPSKIHFLNLLCEKMGAPQDLWRKKHLQVYVYQVEEFHESSLSMESDD